MLSHLFCISGNYTTVSIAKSQGIKLYKKMEKNPLGNQQEYENEHRAENSVVYHTGL